MFVTQIQFFLIHISNTLEVLNSSVNFFIYFAYHRHFRSVVVGCRLIGPSGQAPADDVRDRRGTQTTAGAAVATRPPPPRVLFRLRELRTGAEDQGRQHQQPKNRAASSSEVDVSWRTNSLTGENANDQA